MANDHMKGGTTNHKRSARHYCLTLMGMATTKHTHTHHTHTWRERGGQYLMTVPQKIKRTTI